jgi:hypothetical protein
MTHRLAEIDRRLVASEGDVVEHFLHFSQRNRCAIGGPHEAVPDRERRFQP